MSGLSVYFKVIFFVQALVERNYGLWLYGKNIA